MADHDSVAELIAWYANGTLSPEERSVVESHLEGCVECRALLEDVRTLEAVGRLDAGDLLDHVQAQHLERFATDPESLAPELTEWIEQHLAACAVCRDASRSLQRMDSASFSFAGAEVRDNATGRPVSDGGSVWAILTRTVFHPVAAVVYLAVLALLVPVYRGVVHLPDVERRVSAIEEEVENARVWGGAVDLPVLSGALRGEDAATRVRIESGAPVLPLGAEFELPVDLDESTPIRFEIRREAGDVIWSQDLAAERVQRNLDDAGIVTLLLPRAPFSAGCYRLTVERTDRPGRRPILDAPFEISLQGE